VASGGQVRRPICRLHLALGGYAIQGAFRDASPEGIPENTVKTRLFYARKKLADLLKAAGVERDWS
jgi:hypothetical protein